MVKNAAEQSGMYSPRFYSEKEIKRLREFGFPNTVTLAILDSLKLKNKTFWDVGAGPNPFLGTEVHRLGGEYIPFDQNPQVIEMLLRELPFAVVSDFLLTGDIRNDPLPEDVKFDFTHQRFVQQHAQPNEQEIIIKNLLRRTRGKLIMSEYAWGTAGGKYDNMHLSEFLHLSYRLFTAANGNLHAGDKLHWLTHRVARRRNIQTLQVNRAPGNYWGEVRDLTRSSIHVARNLLKNEQLAQDYEAYLQKIEGNEEDFVPPSIVTVIIS